MPDIRSGAALVIAALCATGTTEIGEAWHIERGYEDMAGKLRQLGASIEAAEEAPREDETGVTYEQVSLRAAPLR